MKGTFVQKNKYCLLPPKVIAVVVVLTANLSKRLRFKKKKETQHSEQKCTLIVQGIKQTFPLKGWVGAPCVAYRRTPIECLTGQGEQRQQHFFSVFQMRFSQLDAVTSLCGGAVCTPLAGGVIPQQSDVELYFISPRLC